MSKKVLFVLVFVLLGLFVLAGCAPQEVEVTRVVTETEEVEVTRVVTETVEIEGEEVEVTRVVEVEKEVPVEVEVPGEARTLVFTSRIFTPAREQEFFINEVIKPFEEEHNVNVDFGILDDPPMLERAAIQQDSGNITTDVIAAHNGRMIEWIEPGWVEDLTEAVGSWDDRHFTEAFVTDTHSDGKQYFLPMAADVYLLLAHENAMAYLPDGFDVDTLTWEQYAEWANAIAEGEGEGKVCITGIPQKSWVYQYGGSGLSYGAGFPDINSPEAAEAWGIWTSMKDAFVPSVLNVDSCVDPMMREEAWLTVFHNARAGQVYASNETAYTLAPAPSGPAGIGTIAGTTGYGVMKGTENYDLAIEFLEYLTRPDVQVKIAKGTGGFIPPVEEARDFLGDEAIDEVINKAVLVLNNGVTSGVPAANYQDWGAVKQVYDDVFVDMVLNGDGTVDQARLDAAQEALVALEVE